MYKPYEANFKLLRLVAHVAICFFGQMVHQQFD